MANGDDMAGTAGLRVVEGGQPAGPGVAPTTHLDLDPLLLAARDGDQHAWSALYHRDYAVLVRHATYLAGDVALAEDAVQEAFAVAVRRIDRYDGRAPFVAWLRGIVTNVLRSRGRKQRRRDRAYARLEEVETRRAPTHDGDPERQAQRRGRALALYRALDQLPVHLREAFIYCDVEQIPAKEAAVELGISPGNLRVRATRARAKLRELLEDDEGGPA